MVIKYNKLKPSYNWEPIIGQEIGRSLFAGILVEIMYHENGICLHIMNDFVNSKID